MDTTRSQDVFRDLERPLIQVTLWALTVGFLLGILVNNFILSLNPLLNIVMLGGTVVNLILLLLFRKGKHMILTKYSLVIMIWAFLNASWYLGYGLKGATLLLYPLFFALIILLLNKRAILWFGILLLINLTILLFIGLTWPEFTGDYKNTESRIIDNFFTILIGGTLLSICLLIAKEGYRKEFLKAKKSEELKSAFMANMSHEIRTPLNAIMGFSELLKEDGDEVTKGQYVDIIYNNSDYLHELIDKVLNISLIDSGNMVVYPSVFQVKEVLDRILLETRLRVVQQAGETIEIQTVQRDPDLLIQTDRVRLEQVLRNLLTNALKFTESGEIVFGVDFVEGQYLFFVQDTGRGIAPEDLPKIFKRFVKLDSSAQNNPRGAGLGLYLCNEIVTHLGGIMRVTSRLNKGTTFHFTLPGPVPAESGQEVAGQR